MRQGMVGALALALLVDAPAVDAAQADQAAPQRGGDNDAADTGKYFYFHKAGVGIDTATADIRECSEYGSNIRNIEPGSQSYYVPYTGNLSPVAAGLAGGIGGALGEMLADVLFKAPQRRAMRRTVLRKCMSFKGYGRYPLAKERWEAVNDGGDRKAVYARIAALAVAPAPTAGALLP